MQFNPSTNHLSMVKKVDDLADTNVTKYPLAQKARAFNTALDRAYSLIFTSMDTKNFDDPNYAKLPQGTYDITIGERNLTIFKDEEGGEILKIHRVIAKNASGDYYELDERDIRDGSRDIAYGDDTGQVRAYDWVGTSLVWDVIPEATIADGVKVFYSRNSTYFTEDDTTKEPGLPSLFHDYPALYAAWEYCVRKGLQRAAQYKKEIDLMEAQMKSFAGNQTLVKNKVLSPHRVNVQ